MKPIKYLRSFKSVIGELQTIVMLIFEMILAIYVIWAAFGALLRH